jgi:membrane protein
MLKVAHVTSTWVRRLKDVLIQSLISWVDQRAASKGAALAFYSLFSMAPILMLSITIAGYFFGAEVAQGEIVSRLAGMVGPNGALAIEAVLVVTKDTGSSLVATLVAAALLLIGTTSVFVELKGNLVGIDA